MSKYGQNRSTAVMQRRTEPHNSLDDYPTQPWGTRALIEHAIGPDRVRGKTCLEPACNRGHMVRPLEEYFGSVDAADVHDYGYGYAVKDFLFGMPERDSYDWVITNPPFRLALPFILRAFEVAREGVAILARTAFVESEERYEGLFRDRPEVFCPFVERLPLFRGRLARPSPRLFDPKAKGSVEGSATSYAWFVWGKDFEPGRIKRIPKCRAQLERPGDYEWQEIDR